MPCKITEYTSTEASGYGVDGQNSYRIVEPTYSLGFSLLKLNLNIDSIIMLILNDNLRKGVISGTTLHTTLQFSLKMKQFFIITEFVEAVKQYSKSVVVIGV